MPIVVLCSNPDCMTSSSVPDTFLGRTVRCKRCQKAFVVKAASDSPPTSKPDRSQSLAKVFPALPAEFGRYRVLKLLGQGGMGAVYLAEDSQLKRPVALKIPFFEGAKSEQRVERFVREARAAAILHHRNICTVFDAGEIDGKPFITMAYLSGVPLDQQIDPEAPMPERQAAEIARKIARALAHAHGKGIVHRDLKPANIMIANTSEPVVMDFGLAKRADHMEAGEAKLTRAGGIVGTPAYMSPEQVKGEGQDIGPPTDIYSLGVILFEMLTGKPPYTGSLVEVMGQILAAPVPVAREFRPDVDPRLDTIGQKAMAKDPAARFHSMLEFSGALDQYLEPASSTTVNLQTETTKTSTIIEAPAAPKENVITLPDALGRRQQRRGYWPALVAVLAALLLPAGYFLLKPGEKEDAPGEAPAVQAAEPKKPPVHAVVFKGDEAKKDPVSKLPPERTEEFKYAIEFEMKTGNRRVIEVEIAPGATMEFVRIPKGIFQMGAPANEASARDMEKPQHEVEITRDFYLGKYKVMQNQYLAVVGSNPSKFMGDRLPVQNVSWEDAVNFCVKLQTYTKQLVVLPTEAQWEYACRAGTSTPFPFGSSLNGHQANCPGTRPYGTTTPGPYEAKPVEVGSYPANPWGLYDMIGNTWEWCEDWFGPYRLITDKADPIQLIQQEEIFHSHRGGSWKHYPWVCRAASRGWGNPGTDGTMGFRVCILPRE